MDENRMEEERRLSLQREIFEKNDSPAAEKWVGKDIPLKK